MQRFFLLFLLTILPCQALIWFDSKKEIPAETLCEDDGRWGIFVTGGYLFWFIGQDQMLLAHESNLKYRHPFNYHSGFMVAISGTTTDSWKPKICYYRCHFSDATEISAPLYLSRGLFIPNNSYDNANMFLSADIKSFNGVNSRWICQFDILDVLLLCPLDHKEVFIFYPTVGSKTIWLDQDWRLTATRLDSTNTEITETINFMSDSWCYGPVSGFCTQWLFGNFSLNTLSLFALLYQSANIAVVIDDDVTSEQIRQMTFATQARMAMEWQQALFDGLTSITLSLGYEFTAIFSQNFARLFEPDLSIEASGAMVSPTYIADSRQAGTLFYHGVIAKAVLSF